MSLSKFCSSFRLIETTINDLIKIFKDTLYFHSYTMNITSKFPLLYFGDCICKKNFKLFTRVFIHSHFTWDNLQTCLNKTQTIPNTGPN